VSQPNACFMARAGRVSLQSKQGIVHSAKMCAPVSFPMACCVGTSVCKPHQEYHIVLCVCYVCVCRCVLHRTSCCL
jgi:hypothetical protein